MHCTENEACFLISQLFFSLPISAENVWIGIANFGEKLQVVPPTPNPKKFADAMVDMCIEQAKDSTTILETELLALTHYFDETNLARGEQVHNIVVIISDGYFTRFERTKRNADLLKSTYGVEIFTISLGSGDTGIAQLKVIASDEYHYSNDDVFKALGIIELKDVCPQYFVEYKS